MRYSGLAECNLDVTHREINSGREFLTVLPSVVMRWGWGDM